MKKILRFLKPYRLSVFLGLFFKFVETMFELLLPVIMASIIAEAAAGRAFNEIMPKGWILLAIVSINIVNALLGQYFAAKVSTAFGMDLRGELFEKINSLSYNGLNAFGVSSLINRLTNDANQVQNAVFMAVRVGARAPFLAIGSFVMAVILDVNISLVFLICIPLVSFTLYYVMKKTVPMYDEVQTKLDTVTTVTRENFTGARVVRAFSRQHSEQRRFEGATAGYHDKALKVVRLSSLINPVTTLVMQLGIVAILILGGTRANSGLLEPAQLTAFVTYILQILLAMIVLANLIILFIKASASGNRIQQVFEFKSEEQEKQPLKAINHFSDSEKLLEFKDVHFAYSGSMDILKGISFTLNKGESLGIIGGTGSGKTTLINLLPRFYDPTQGEIFLYGKNIFDYRPEDLRQIIGVVPQKAILIKGTVRENLAMGAPISEEALIAALKTSQSKFVLSHKEGLNRQIEQGGRNLSGGQKQRLTIARALAKSPQILILDDSSSALDYSTDAALFRALKREKDISTIIVSQRVSSIMRTDKILVLSGGSIACEGKHSELLENCEIYRDIYDTQTKKQR